MVPLVYRDIARDRYLISESGEIFTISGRQLFGCNPDNEKGYVRVTLVTIDGKLKKYPLHRLVLATFTFDCDLEVNHKDGNKLHNWLSNLEYVTGDENKHHASVNGLYVHGEDHHFSVLTNDQVHDICELFQRGLNVRKVQKALDLKDIKNIDQILTRILYRQTWTQISKNYNWSVDDIRHKTYKLKHLKTIAKLIQYNQFTSREIAKKFSQYDEKKLVQVIKKMRQGKLYTDIMKEVEGSTTIVNELYDGDGFTILVRKR